MSTSRVLLLASLGLSLAALSSVSCTSQPAAYQAQTPPAPVQPQRYGPAPQPTVNPVPVAAPTPTAQTPNRGGGVVALGAANFDATLNQPGAIVVVDFAAVWCGPCRQLEPVVERIAADFAGQAIVARVDVDSDPQLANRYGVDTLPTLAFFKNGQLQTIKVGLTSEQEIAAQLRQLMR